MEQQKCTSCVKEPTNRINVARFIAKMDTCFAKDDLKGAKECIDNWKTEADALGDSRGMLAIVNEELGLYRRLGDKVAALDSVIRAEELLSDCGIKNHLSGATILVNMGTTCSFAGKKEEAIPFYDQAQKIFLEHHEDSSYEYAALLNNKASVLNDLMRYDEAKECYLKAIELLKADGTHDGEIAVSLMNLAHLTFDANDEAYEEVEELLDLCWEYINSDRITHDANYAFVISKCAPSFDYFQRPLQAKALRSVAKEIYGRD